MLLNNYWSIEKSKESLRKISEDKNENVAYLNLWDEQKNEREIYKNTDLPQDTRMLSTNNLILYLKEVEKEEDTAQIQ